MQERMSIKEVAAYLGVSRTKVWTLIKEGVLAASQNPLDKREHLVPSSMVERLKEHGKNGDTGPRDRPLPRTFGIYEGPVEVHSDELEEYMREHWRPA